MTLTAMPPVKIGGRVIYPSSFRKKTRGCIDAVGVCYCGRLFVKYRPNQKYCCVRHRDDVQQKVYKRDGTYTRIPEYLYHAYQLDVQGHPVWSEGEGEKEKWYTDYSRVLSPEGTSIL